MRLSSWLDVGLAAALKEPYRGADTFLGTHDAGSRACAGAEPRRGSHMQSEKLSYPGIAGAVAGVVGLLGVFMSWFEIAGPNGTIRIDGTAHSSGKLAFAMSIALFAFSVGYVLLDDRRIRRSMAALIIASAVILVLACLLGVTSAADSTDLAVGFSLSVLGGLLGVGAGILTLRDAPVGEVIPDDAEEHASAEAEAPATVS